MRQYKRDSWDVGKTLYLDLDGGYLHIFAL